MKCQKCGTEYEGNFCSNCGANGNQIQIKCSKCGALYAGNFCPNGCNSPHYQNRKKKKGKGVAVATILICMFTFAAIMGVLFGEETPEDSPSSSVSENVTETESKITYIEVSARDLWNAFSDNEVAADETYKGEYVKVTGVVNNINSDGVWTSANILLEVDGDIFGCIQCNFNNSENAKAIANVKKGQKVTVTGTCGGLELYNLMINGCELQ